MTSNFGIRYASLLGIVATMFVTFVACGSQLYRVAMVGDASNGASTPLQNLPGENSNQDPSSPQFGLFAPSGWPSLPIHFRTDYTMTPDQVQGLQQAMHTWEIATGRQLFAYDGVHQGVTGDTFKDLYSSLDDNINGLYLDNNWEKTGKPTVVLATTIWNNDPGNVNMITTSDIRFNDEYYVFGDALVITSPNPNRQVVDIRTLATHELGHMLGLAHVPPSVDPNSIMVPSLYIGEGMTSRHLSPGDIARIQRIYGCQGDACDVDQVLAAIDGWVEDPSTTQAPSNSETTKN